ncbi:Uncharacterised protein [Mycobacteroides abscessus subsp. abscessus]|nr:Uncharacterised protein [Mycobacteroides abscessus subsp. abscessus]
MVIPRIWNLPPSFQSIVLLMMFFTKSMTHSKKFCIPVGFMASVRVERTAMMKTMALATVIINMFAKLKFKPRNSTIGAS